jgi:predicted phosphodiesterase
MRTPARAAVTGLALLAACLEWSPHQLPTDESERDLNRKAVERIVATPVDRLRFAVVGDTQRSFDHAEDVVEALNRRDDIQFVVQMGDFANVGLWLEFREMNEIFSRLDVPYLVVVGVHDLFSNGRAIYEEMFGPRDFAFTHGRVRFVVFDDNSGRHEGGVPDVAWIEAALAPSSDHDRALAFSHVPLGHGGVDAALSPLVEAALAEGGVEISFHSHAHRFEIFERGGLTFVIADSVDHRSYVVVSQGEDGAFDLEKVDF